MSRRSKNFNLPLRNITASFNSSKMSYSSDSGFPDSKTMMNSPVSNLAFNLSELSTGNGRTPRLRRKLSLSSLDTPPYESGQHCTENSSSAESGCFSGSPLDDSPTLSSLSLKRYTTALHPDIPLEAFSVKKKTIAFRRISSEPLPQLRLDSPTDFSDEDKDENEKPQQVNDENEDVVKNFKHCENQYRVNSRLFSEETCSQDSGLGLEQDRVGSVLSFEDAASVPSTPSPTAPKRSSISSFDTGSLSSSSSSLNQFDSLPSLEDVWNSMSPQGSPGFKAPRGKAPKRSRSMVDDKQYSEETCSPIKYSPVKSSSLPRPSFSKSLFSQIPESPNESIEENKSSRSDGFLELFQLEDVELKNEADDHVSTLINGPLLHHPGPEEKTEELTVEEPPFALRRVNFVFPLTNDTPSSRPTVGRRGLHRSQSMDIRPRPSSKRCEPPLEGTTPIQSKRWRGDNDDTLNNSCGEADIMNTDKLMNLRRLQRCHSETEATIKLAVSRMFEQPDLIGDCSKPYCLPTIKGKHQDLKSISSETMSRILANEYIDDIEEYHIIDCRYPYEYEGGHIQNALNIYTKEDIIEKYLKTPLVGKDSSKRMILIFHCEFSSERGPGLFRFLRRRDRESNKECYPKLHYPEVYLLEGGYKNFFENYSHLCEPQTYKTMFDKQHSEDMRKFRAKCKSWTDEKTQQHKSGMRNLRF